MRISSRRIPRFEWILAHQKYGKSINLLCRLQCYLTARLVALAGGCAYPVGIVAGEFMQRTNKQLGQGDCFELV